MAASATAVRGVASGAPAMRTLGVKRGRIECLNVEELEVGRLCVRALVVDRSKVNGEEHGDESTDEAPAHPESSRAHNEVTV